MCLCVCENIMKHFTACNIQFPECRRLTLFSCVITILTSWKGLCGYYRDDMSCQDFCTVCLLRTFPSHYSSCKQHVIPVVQYLHVVFYCFLIFSWWFHQLGILLWECYYIFYGPQPPPVPIVARAEMFMPYMYCLTVINVTPMYCTLWGRAVGMTTMWSLVVPCRCDNNLWCRGVVIVTAPPPPV